MNNDQITRNSDERLCTIDHLNRLDSFIRKIAHNPRRLLKPFIKEGMSVMDLGCGGGFATIALAEMVGGKGEVIAADVQEEMLAITKERVKKSGLSDRVSFHRCSSTKIGYDGKLDFVLAFYMLHETGNIPSFLEDIYGILENGGLLYVSEPTFHVSPEEFSFTQEEAEKAGFTIFSLPKVLFGRSAVFKK